MQNRNVGTVELLLLGLAGAGVGLAAGFALAFWTGRVSGARVKSAARRLKVPLTAQEEAIVRAPGELARRAEGMIAADVQLAPLGLSCVPLGRAGLEIHGWVPSRGLRARAARLVQEVPGVERLVNCLLVRGEDDRDAYPDDSNEQTPQTA